MTQPKRRIHIKLNEVLKEHNITQKELAETTDIRPAAISEMKNNQRQSINREHLAKICDALDIDDINEIIAIVNTGGDNDG